nr:hypothetical protein [Tanacetum cinerariifolium]
VSVAKVPTGSGSIPTASAPGTRVPTGGVPTGSSVVPTASPIFTTATVATPYTRRKGKEKMVEFETPKKKKLQEQIDVEMARQQLCKSSQVPDTAKKAPLKEATERVLYVSAQESLRLESKALQGDDTGKIKEKFDPV